MISNLQCVYRGVQLSGVSQSNFTSFPILEEAGQNIPFQIDASDAKHEVSEPADD